MHTAHALEFSDVELADAIHALDIDAAPFGVIGFDAQGIVRRYNRTESQLAGLASDRVVGKPLFATVAPCMNNYLVAQRFDEAAEAGSDLDVAIDYVLTLRMRPQKVKLRLIARPGAAMRYVLIQRKG
jgi:photoactive yellow protein